MFLLELVLLIFLSVSGVWAQDMAQCEPGYDWNRNSLGQDPCTVGSILDASCRALVTYNYPPLNATEYYSPPRAEYQGDLNCDCNTVMYILYMACASCQGAQFYSWPAWIQVCPSVYITEYPRSIPQGTRVPRWAFFNVTSSPDQTYDQAALMNVGRDPEETPAVLPNVTSTAQPAPTSDPSSVTEGGTNVGAIVGGVVGSVVPLTILAVVVFFFVRHRRQQKVEPQALNQDEQRSLSVYGPSNVPVSLTPHNPYDPLTFPPWSSQNSVTYSTPIHTPRGTYTGIPEV